MAKPKDTSVKTYEVGLKNHKPFVVEATRMTIGSYSDTTLKFFMLDELVMVVAHQKWNYVRVSEF